MPVVPRTGVTQVTLNVGQRVDIIINANQAANNYWMRVQRGCPTAGEADIYDSAAVANGQVVPGGILHYSTAGTNNPTSTPYTLSQTCNDEVVTPKWTRTVPSTNFATSVGKLNYTLGTTQRAGNTIVAWFINQSTMVADWSNPTLQYVVNGITTYPASMNLYQLSGTATTWTYWVMQWTGGNGPPLPHPVHLHGHNFYVLGAGQGTFSGTTAGLNFNNPVRRDTAMIPANGWIVVAFLLDNPGAWLMHCHIAWHLSEGMSLQFLERRSEIQTKIPASQFTGLTNNCNAWRSFYNGPNRVWAETDSGL